jgi:tetratricopeptide (TPR) repeat protein
MLRTPLVTAALVAFLAVCAPARASEQTDLEKARAAYLARQYDEADARFRAILNPTTGSLRDPVLVTQARMYWGAVLVAKARPEEATALFEKLILADPGFEPDPLSFPTDVIDLYIDTRARIRDKINAAAQQAARAEAARRAREEEARRRESARIVLLERMAAEEKIIERHSRWVALLPFGVGQFQNGQKTLGWFFLLGESALTLATAVTVPIYLYDLSNRTAAAAGDTAAARQWVTRGEDVFRANLILVGALGFTAAVGVLQAQLTYVPETVEVRRRPIPLPQVSQVTLAPLVAPILGGGAGDERGARGITLGLTGRF